MNFVILGNPLYKWILFILTATASYIILKILTNSLKKQFSKKLPGSLNKSISYILIIFQQTKLFFLLILSIYIGTAWLTLPEKIFLYLRTIIIFVSWIQVGIWLNEIIGNYINLRSNQAEDGENRTTMNALKTILKIVLWSIIFILIIDNIPDCFHIFFNASFPNQAGWNFSNFP